MAAAEGSPALLKADRAYQTAAAHFYGRDFSAAAAEFVAISNDGSSPWQPISGYVAARALIRQAFFARSDPTVQADYDPSVMKAAGEQLRAYLAGDPSPDMRKAAERLLALVRIRTEPEQRGRELGALVAGPEHDANYSQDLKDLLWLANAKTPDGLRAQPEPWMQVPDAVHPGQMRPATEQEAESAAATKRDQAYEGSGAIRAAVPILDWAITLQSLSSAAAAHALTEWRKTHAMPWMVAALMLAPSNRSTEGDLLNAAAAVSPASPVWQTVSYHRARLLLGTDRVNEARVVLADFSARLAELPDAERSPSSVNALRGLQMLAARTEAEFFPYVPRTTLLYSSEEYSSVRECKEVMKDPARHYNCAVLIAPEQMAADAAGVFNSQAPLSFWLRAAQAASLSSQLRDAIAMEGWTRAVLLDDKAKADAFLPLLPAALRAQAGEVSTLAAWMTLARNPGLRPYVNGGTQRAYSYDFVESYRDNWCYKPDNDAEGSPAPAFLSAAEKEKGAEEMQRLATIRSVFVGQRIVRAVQTNLDDAHAAEALYLVLRMIRYGCTEPAPPAPVAPPSANAPAMTYSPEAQELLRLKQEAARLLRQHYAASPWTKKAASFAG